MSTSNACSSSRRRARCTGCTRARRSATPRNRWRDLTMSSRHIVQLAEDIAIISYRADVTRANVEPYAALGSSGYVKRAEGWKLAFRQHSPL